MLELRQLVVLVNVARLGSYSAAALELSYTQPAVSYQMRALEKAVGTRLVSHVGRGVRLTAAGELLARHAEAVLAAARQAESEVSALGRRGGDMLRLAAFPSACATLVPAAIRLLSQRGEALEVVVEECGPDAAVTQVRAAAVDVAISCDWGGGPPRDREKGLHRVALFADRQRLVLPLDHPLADREAVGYADLVREPWILEPVPHRQRIQSACEAAGFSPRVRATATDHASIVALAAGGAGVAVLTDLALAAVSRTDVVVKPLLDSDARNVYCLMWPDIASLGMGRTFVDALRTVVGPLTAVP